MVLVFLSFSGIGVKRMGKDLGGFWKPDRAAYLSTLMPDRINFKTLNKWKKIKKRKEKEKRNQEKNLRRRYKPNAFLDSDEWKKLRYEALLKYGRRCACCGATPKDGIILHVDHIKPRSKFPELAMNIENLQILCEACNIGKGAWDQTNFKESNQQG